MPLSKDQRAAIQSAAPDLRQAARVLDGIVNAPGLPRALREMLRGPATSIRLQAQVWTSLAQERTP